MLPMGLQGIDGCVFSHNSRAKPFNLFWLWHAVRNKFYKVTIAYICVCIYNLYVNTVIYILIYINKV
jgi:hypothetical protein